MYKIGMVTDTGSGIRRIMKLVKQYTGKEAGLEATDNEFILTLPRKIERK